VLLNCFVLFFCFMESLVLPRRVSLEDAQGKIEGYFLQRGWSDVRYANLYRLLDLSFVPYYFFHFDVLRVGSKSSVATHGFLALNALRNEFSSSFDSIKEDYSSLAVPVSDEDAGLVRVPSLSKGEANDIIKVRLASRFGVLPESVLVSGLDLVFVPFYKSVLKLGEDVYEFHLNAFSGSLVDVTGVPVRERDFEELLRETVRDVGSPSKWGSYFGEIFFDTVQTAKGESRRVSWLLFVILFALLVSAFFVVGSFLGWI
jgi:hypothetical protein